MHSVKGKRDRAILAVLLGCGLRRKELVDLDLDNIQRREDHWAIVDLVGKRGHIRTVPIPELTRLREFFGRMVKSLFRTDSKQRISFALTEGV